MLNVYAAAWCPHCKKTVSFLKDNKIEFNYIEIEEQSEAVIQSIIGVNGGDDWVVPTLEFNGKWRQGKVFNEVELKTDLQKMGVIK